MIHAMCTLCSSQCFLINVHWVETSTSREPVVGQKLCEINKKSIMLLKILMVLCYHSFVICQVNSSGVIKPPNREKDLCVSDNCLSKCCPKGMVYKKIPKKKSVCVIGDDSILNHKQKVYQELWFVDSVYLKDTNDILYGVPCHKKHIVNHPFYLQQVSYRY